MMTERDLSPGDVFLYHGHNILGWAIRLLDGTDVNHAAIYLGDGKVGEALGQGVVQTELAQSVQGSVVRVFRHAPLPSDMKPVLGEAQAILKDGHSYAYGEILLLALLSITRKLPLPHLMGGLLRGILDKAAAILMDITSQGRKPMICSEFVYRCYNQALTDDRTPYKIKIAGALKAIGTAPGPRIDPESLLARLSAAPALKAALRAPVDTTPPSLEQIEHDLEGFKKKVDSGQERGIVTDAVLAKILEELTGHILNFVWKYLAALGKSPADPSRAIADLFHAQPDFVTPGDLLKSPSLSEKGRIA